MTSSRTRTTVTVRHDDPVPRSRRKNNSNVLIAAGLILLALFLVARSHRSAPQPQRVVYPR